MMASTKKMMLLTIFLVSTGCTGVRESMMADGNTWDVGIKDISGGCNGYSSAESCIETLQPRVEERGRHLCGKEPHRVFGCTKSSDVYVHCKVQCNPSPQQEIVSPSHEKGPAAPPGDAPPEKSVVEKARRCQKKGGLWINNSCQLDIEDESVSGAH